MLGKVCSNVIKALTTLKFYLFLNYHTVCLKANVKIKLLISRQVHKKACSQENERVH